ncbi:hypothetical protein [Streptomyces sp. NRRL WC-3618]|uniref:hypothetical protein n=1 Tax=Streptomyces sp. NRRL WC-3618 TaxID=1519490 RepID=UPI000A83F74F|nr:hypothetical protein [Streptomyces sp. NRRL WC-3618]
MTYDHLPHLRLLPWTGTDDKQCYLLADGTGTNTGVLSRHADQIEAVQLGLAGRLLGRAREVAAAPEVSIGELRLLAVQLADGLRDALLIAESRGTRLGRGEWLSAGESSAACPNRRRRLSLRGHVPRHRPSRPSTTS